MWHIHLGPENALEALELLGGGAFLPVPWGTFSLAMHAWDEPAETLVALGPKRGAQLVMPRLGEPVALRCLWNGPCLREEVRSEERLQHAEQDHDEVLARAAGRD